MAGWEDRDKPTTPHDAAIRPPNNNTPRHHNTTKTHRAPHRNTQGPQRLPPTDTGKPVTKHTKGHQGTRTATTAQQPRHRIAARQREPHTTAETSRNQHNTAQQRQHGAPKHNTVPNVTTQETNQHTTTQHNTTPHSSKDHDRIKPLFVLKQLFAFSFSGSVLSVFVFLCGVSACEHQGGWETRTTGDRRTCREWQQS